MNPLLITTLAIWGVHTIRTFATLSKFKPLEKIMKNVKIGDMLEFNRGAYTHFALYVGNGYVMNVDAEDKSVKYAYIKRRRIWDVCGNSTVRIKNHNNTAWDRYKIKPQSPRQIVMDALEYENRCVPYQFTGKNCEFYCTLWRFGVGFSKQVAELTGNLGISRMAVAIPFLSTAVYGLEGIYTAIATPYSKYKRISN